MMKIVNEKELSENAVFDEDRRTREAALKILRAALNSADPRIAVRNNVHRVDDTLSVDNLTFDLDKFQRIFVVGGGKASGAMAEALEEIVGDNLTEGFINVLRDIKSSFKTQKIFLNKVRHPIPDENGVEGAIKIIQLARKAKEKDLIICLISGGGSALIPLPAAGITLQDKQKLTEALLKCGATIDEINSVRKHISGLKGGQLAKASYPATLISLILSDVVGDPLDTIASGPTAPDTTTFGDAISILKKYDLWKFSIPKSIRKRLEAGSKGKIQETPKPGDKAFDKTHNVIIGNNRSVALAACQEAKSLGFNQLLLSSMIEGEARHVGIAYAGIMEEILYSNNPIPKPAVVIAGGETTVTVTGRGKGGRNQELVLSASLKIEELRGVAIASIGTDGIDGPTDAAGAIADGQTIKRACNKKLNAREFLMNNDSYGFFSKLDDLIFTGSTGTNVNDLAVMVVV
jgi:glycerate 2-kinase